MPVSQALKRAQTRYRDRNIEEGMARVSVWIPKKYADEMRAIAEEMRQEARQEMEQQH